MPWPAPSTRFSAQQQVVCSVSYCSGRRSDFCCFRDFFLRGKRSPNCEIKRHRSLRMMKLFSFATDEKHPCHIFVVGNRGAGKTCFLSGLDEYGKAHQGGELAVIHDDGKTARELDELDSIRRSGRWPLPTAHTTHL